MRTQERKIGRRRGGGGVEARAKESGSSVGSATWSQAQDRLISLHNPYTHKAQIEKKIERQRKP